MKFYHIFQNLFIKLKITIDFNKKYNNFFNKIFDEKNLCFELKNRHYYNFYLNIVFLTNRMISID